MESGVLKVLRKVNLYFEKYEYGMAMVTMGVTTLVTITQVVTRYGFNHPLTWPEEFSTLLMVWMTFAGAGYLLKKRMHIEIDFLTNFLPRKWQKAIDLFNYFLMFCFCLVAAWGAYKLQWFQSRHYTVALRIPKNFFSLPVLIAGVSMCLYLIFAFIKGLTELLHPEKEETEPEAPKITESIY
jgi:TRAP-type C4-dicarboxylate transport system permease small subunit